MSGRGTGGGWGWWGGGGVVLIAKDQPSMARVMLEEVSLASLSSAGCKASFFAAW